jgi:hypothetical protein
VPEHRSIKLVNVMILIDAAAAGLGLVRAMPHAPDWSPLSWGRMVREPLASFMAPLTLALSVGIVHYGVPIATEQNPTTFRATPSRKRPIPRGHREFGRGPLIPRVSGSR